ncbi:MAG: hypothetical protein MJ252_21295 [archaeon]|nr:hypothetical protein [archaeon]
MSQIKTLSITGIKEQSTNSISHIKSLNSKKYQNLNLSYNNSFHTINQSKAFLEDSPQIKRSYSHKKRHYKVDIGNIVNEELDEDEGSDSDLEGNSENNKEKVLKPKTRSHAYSLLLRKVDKKKENNENDFKQFLRRFDEEEEIIFDDYMKFDLDDISVDEFDIKECYNINDNKNISPSCSLLGSNDSCSISRQIAEIDKQNKISDDEGFFENFEHVPTILDKILKQEEQGGVSSGCEKLSSTEKDKILSTDKEKNSSSEMEKDKILSTDKEKNSSSEKENNSIEKKNKSKNESKDIFAPSPSNSNSKSNINEQ